MVIEIIKCVCKNKKEMDSDVYKDPSSLVLKSKGLTILMEVQLMDCT